MAPPTGLGQSAVVAARTTKMTQLTEKIAKLKEEMQRQQVLEAQILATPDHQISTDRSRCAFDGDERPWLRRGGLQRHAHYTGMLSRGHRLFLPFGVR